MGGVYAASLMSAAAAACAGEYVRITRGKLEPIALVSIVGAALLPLWPVIVPERSGEAAFGTLGVAFLAAWVAPLFYGELSDAPSRAAHLLLGLAYGGVGLYALSALR